MSSVLAAHITRADAERLTGGPVVLHYYPLTGVSFILQAVRGPASRIDGRVFHTVTDRATGSIATSEAWELGDVADVDASAVWKEYEPAGDEAKRSVVTAARQTLTTRLLRTVRLGGQFELRVNQVIDPLWKPNWLYTDKNKRVQILVDGLNGGTAKRRL